MVQLLLQAGAKVALEADNGATALSLATGAGHDEVVAMLRQAGQDFGETPTSR